MARRERGGTLRAGKGHAQRTASAAGRTLNSLYAAGITFAAAAVGLMALVLALAAALSPGVVADDPGGVVRFVDPGGFAWRSGIRAGQRVISVSAVDDEGGWSIETADSAGQRRATTAAATATLRQSAPMAAAALLLGLLGLVAMATRRRRAELLAGLSLALAAPPLWLAEDAFVATIGGVLAPVALATWALRWLDLRPLVAAALRTFLVALAFVYPLATLQGGSLSAELDGARLVGTLALAAGVLMAALDLRLERLASSAARLRLLDAGVGVAVVAVAAVLGTSLATPIPIVATVVGVVLLVYLGLRTGIARLADRVLLAEVRERAAVQGAEEERARLSRNLHDDPLQALAGVIHRLERQPDTAEERDALRSVAAHLRDVATELHPPILDDLGLVPAIEELLPTDTEITVSLGVDHGGYERLHRPPSEVEVTIYRIVQEALSNAIAHSGCRTIRIDGEIGRDHVVIEVIDDGRGITGREIEAAMRGGHIGVASMRRRADAIDARLTHRGTPGIGTTVSVRWRA